MPLQHFELTNLNTIAFQVADDPFFKSLRARFYPEVVIMNMSGKVKARVNPFSRKYTRKGKDALLFDDDFREPKLKINDDRRVQINLGALQPKERQPPSIKESVVSGNPSMIQTPDNYHRFNGKMVLLTVKVFVENFKGQPMRPGEFDKAWYRLVNVDTS